MQCPTDLWLGDEVSKVKWMGKSKGWEYPVFRWEKNIYLDSLCKWQETSGKRVNGSTLPIVMRLQETKQRNDSHQGFTHRMAVFQKAVQENLLLHKAHQQDTERVLRCKTVDPEKHPVIWNQNRLKIIGRLMASRYTKNLWKALYVKPLVPSQI